MESTNHNETLLLSLKNGKYVGVEKWIFLTEIEKSGKALWPASMVNNCHWLIFQGFPLVFSMYDWIIILDVFKTKTMREKGQVRQKSTMGRGQVIVKGNWAKEIKINSKFEVPLLEGLLMCMANARLPPEE